MLYKNKQVFLFEDLSEKDEKNLNLFDVDESNQIFKKLCLLQLAFIDVWELVDFVENTEYELVNLSEEHAF